MTLNHENTSSGAITIDRQFIKSIKEVKGKKNYYHYYSLSRECFSSKSAAIKRKLSFFFLDIKDYRLSNLEGSCVRIIDTGAYFGTFKEQPRIFNLFNDSLNNE